MHHCTPRVDTYCPGCKQLGLSHAAAKALLIKLHAHVITLNHAPVQQVVLPLMGWTPFYHLHEFYSKKDGRRWRGLIPDCEFLNEGFLDDEATMLGQVLKVPLASLFTVAQCVTQGCGLCRQGNCRAHIQNPERYNYFPPSRKHARPRAFLRTQPEREVYL